LVDANLCIELGGPASQRFVTQPPIAREPLRDTCRLVEHWINNCCVNHKKCSTAQKEGVPLITPLPTRVLELSGDPEAPPSVRLLYTNGTQGSYCALSHCWGKVEILRTLHKNLEDHYMGIPLAALPKTFRDAALLAWGIGCRFIWIDSLCIIQDDHDDWLAEGQKMGSIYRNAALVIAAAGAKDATEGLRFMERRNTMTVLASYLENDYLEGSLKIAPHPESTEVCLSLLRTRGWVFQEWYLARRLVFFMPENLAWKCESQQLDERGHHSDHKLFEKHSWLFMLVEYSRKRLTFAKDRLHALKGIATELQKEMPHHQYLYQYGVWENVDFIEQLLWRRDAPELADYLPGLPTWTWAATGGDKWWCATDVNRWTKTGGYQWWCATKNEEPSQRTPGKLNINNNGLLEVTGGRTVRFKGLSDCDLTKAELGFDIEDPGANFFTVYRDDFDERTVPPSYFLRHNSCDESIFGMAVFDDDPIPYAECFILARTYREEVE
jgi:hypothetical protein